MVVEVYLAVVANIFTYKNANESIGQPVIRSSVARQIVMGTFMLEEEQKMKHESEGKGTQKHQNKLPYDFVPGEIAGNDESCRYESDCDPTDSYLKPDDAIERRQGSTNLKICAALTVDKRTASHGREIVGRFTLRH